MHWLNQPSLASCCHLMLLLMKSLTGSKIPLKNLVKHIFPSFEGAINACFNRLVSVNSSIPH